MAKFKPGDVIYAIDARGEAIDIDDITVIKPVVYKLVVNNVVARNGKTYYDTAFGIAPEAECHASYHEACLAIANSLAQLIKMITVGEIELVELAEEGEEADIGEAGEVEREEGKYAVVAADDGVHHRATDIDRQCQLDQRQW